MPTMASYICSKHFTTDDYRFSDSKKVKEGSIPSVFNFPEHLQSSKRKLPATRIIIHKENTSAFSNVECASKKIKISPSKEDLREKIN